MSRCRAVDGGGQALAHHVEGFDLRADWRHCCRHHDVAAGAAGRRHGTGITAIAGCGTRQFTLLAFMHSVTTTRHGPGEIGHAGRRGQPAPNPNHVRGWRRAVAAGMARPLAARATRTLRRCGSAMTHRAVPARRLRRSRRHVSSAQGRHEADRARPSVAAGHLDYLANAWRQPDEGHLGGARRAAALRSFQGHGLGRIRSRRA